MKNRLQAFRWWDSVHSESTPHSAAERAPTHIAELKTSFIINIQAIYSGYIQDAKTAVKTAEDSPGCKYILFSEGYFWGFFQSTLMTLERLHYSWVGFDLLWNNTCNLFDFSFNLMIKYVRLDKSNLTSIIFLCNMQELQCGKAQGRVTNVLYNLHTGTTGSVNSALPIAQFLQWRDFFQRYIPHNIVISELCILLWNNSFYTRWGAVYGSNREIIGNIPMHSFD